MEGVVGWIISLVSGAVGGNVAGGVLKKQNLGVIWNSVAGIVGGGLGGEILSLLGVPLGGQTATGAVDIGSIIGNIAGSGVGGAILLLIVGFIKNAFGSKGL